MTDAEPFFEDARRHPLLDRPGEAALARRIEAGRAARHALADAAVMDRAEQARLVAAVRAGDDARRRFTEANLRLVISVARAFQGRGLSLADLVQEGNTGLLRAVDGFDWRRGFKFSTYAVWWIRQAIQRALSEQGHPLRLSSTGADDLARVQRTIADFEDVERRAPSLDEVAMLTGLPAARVTRVLDAITPLVSLDAPLSESGDTVGTLVADEAPAVDEVAERTTFHRVLDRMLAVLDERERCIVCMRYGLGCDEATSADIARVLHLSQERVRQIEARAMSKLRHPSLEPEARMLLAG